MSLPTFTLPLPTGRIHLNLAKTSPVTPTEVFRIASPCTTLKCQHFDGQDCRLAQLIVDKLSVVLQELPPCSIRRDCRCWQQEGKAACMRCPQVITDNYNPSELMREVATPHALIHLSSSIGINSTQIQIIIFSTQDKSWVIFWGFVTENITS